jgi:hypothetical protein
MGHTSTFRRMNLTWGGLLQNSCEGCWLMTRTSIGWKSAWNLRSRSEMTHTSFPGS